MKVIYQIVNTITNHFYVGSTKNFEERKKDHLKCLRGNRHHSKYLQNSFNKHGENSFHFVILEEVDSIEELFLREQFYLDSLNPKYNMQKEAGKGWKGTKFSTETLEKIRKNNEKNKKPVTQYDLNGTIVKNWDSIIEVAKAIGASTQLVSGCCNGNRKTCKGYRFSFKGETLKYTRPSRAKYESLDSRKQAWSKTSKARKKKIIDWPSKEKLSHLLKTETFVTIGKLVGVTDSTVRKHVRKLGLIS